MAADKIPGWLTSTLPALAGLALGLWGCFDTGKSTAGTEVENEAKVGFIRYADGSPAEGAKVRIIPVSYAPKPQGLLKRLFGSGQDSTFTFTTDSLGRYPLGQVPAGQYNILGSKAGQFAYRDSVGLDPSASNSLSDTLRASGSLAGVVALQPNHDPRTVLVQLLGTDYYSQPNEGGRFSFGGIPAGIYTAKLTTTLPNYTPLIAGLRVRMGATDTLPDTLRLTYTGIPVVVGLRVSLDTLAGVAKLTWSPVHFPRFLGYRVYRDPEGSLGFAKSPLGNARITDTVFYDTLYRNGGDTVPHAWEYRVRVQDVNGDSGEVFLPAVLRAVPPRAARTSIQLRVLGGHHDSASVNDTVRVALSFSNPTRRNDSVLWYAGAAATPVRTATPRSGSGEDTVTLVAPATPGLVPVRVRMVDEGGSVWRDSLSIQVLADPPVVRAIGDTTVSIRDTVRLSAGGSDGFGRIVKWEWDIGGMGSFHTVLRPDTVVVAPDSAKAVWPCVVRATDDDGQATVDTVRVRVVWDPPVAMAGADSFGTIGDTLRIRDMSHDGFGRIVRRELAVGDGGPFVAMGMDTLIRLPLRPDTNFHCRLRVTDDDGVQATDMVRIRLQPGRLLPGLANKIMMSPPLCALDGMVYAVGGQIGAFYKPETEAYDTASRTWKQKAQMTLGRVNFQPAVVGGAIFAIGEGMDSKDRFTISVEGYDPIKDEWSTKQPMTDTSWRPALAGLGSSVYAIGGDANGRQVARFEPSTDMWTTLNPLPKGIGVGVAVTFGGKIYLFGGEKVDGTNTVREVGVALFDTTSGTWSSLPDLPKDVTGPVLAIGGRIWFFGISGPEVYSWDPEHEETWAKEFPLLQSHGYGRFSGAAIGDRVYLIGSPNPPNSTTNTSGEEYWTKAARP